MDNAVLNEKRASEEELEALLKSEKENLEENNEEAELNAEQDSISKEPEVETNYRKVHLSKPYHFGDESISEIDLSGLDNLTTLDGQMLDQEMSILRHHPVNKYRDILYCKHVAMRVTGLPVDFFNLLKLKDMNEVVSAITYYFLFE